MDVCGHGHSPVIHFLWSGEEGGKVRSTQHGRRQRKPQLTTSAHIPQTRNSPPYLRPNSWWLCRSSKHTKMRHFRFPFCPLALTCDWIARDTIWRVMWGERRASHLGESGSAWCSVLCYNHLINCSLFNITTILSMAGDLQRGRGGGEEDEAWMGGRMRGSTLT